MTGKTQTRLGTASIWLSVIPWLALIAYAVIAPPCQSPLAYLLDIMFFGTAISFVFGIVAVIRDRPKKRAVIGLSMSSLIIVGLLTLFIFIIYAIATGGSPNVQIFYAGGAALPPKIEPGVFISTKTDYYDVSGSTEQELRAQMASLGPRGYAAYTDVYHRWLYDFKEHDGVCGINHVRVDTNITFTYPRWKDEAGNQKLAEGWQKNLAALENHEKGHEEIGRKASQDIYENLLMLIPAYPSCSQLNRAANALAEEVAAEADKKSREYDRVTGHGRIEAVQN